VVVVALSGEVEGDAAVVDGGGDVGAWAHDGPAVVVCSYDLPAFGASGVVEGGVEAGLADGDGVVVGVSGGVVGAEDELSAVEFDVAGGGGGGEVAEEGAGVGFGELDAVFVEFEAEADGAV